MVASYTDQPYCAVNNASIVTLDEVWTCVITASKDGEGSTGEQVYSVLSEDQGNTWSHPVTVEKGTSFPGGRPNAYANIVLANERSPLPPRLYTIYNLNRDNVSSPAHAGRVDELGFFYMRFSDDDGRSWSDDRFLVPYPNTWIDEQNDFHGKTHIMWTVDHIKRMPSGVVAFAFTKIGRYVQNPPEEIFFMASPNLLSAANASDVQWELLPKSQNEQDPQNPADWHGLRAPDMYNPNITVMEEGHLLPLKR